jgi:uncharacterized protein YdeI (YjbR/CyaY-like superfamily)
MPATPRFFRTPAAFRSWLEKHHAKETELWIGYYKKASGKGGMIYKEALDQALCFGWIDGVVKSIGDESYMQRFTPRRKNSHWSNVNVRRFAELDAAGLIQPSGRAAYDRRTAERTGKAFFESPPLELTPGQTRALKANPTAWKYWNAQPPGYQRTVKHWVNTAKHADTRERRLKLLIESCAEKRPLRQFTSRKQLHSGAGVE